MVYDATVYSGDRFLGRFDRTRGEMIQAARSGKQNIIEGSEASGTSKETEIKLTNVARASQKERLEAIVTSCVNASLRSGRLNLPTLTACANPTVRREPIMKPSEKALNIRIRRFAPISSRV